MHSRQRFTELAVLITVGSGVAVVGTPNISISVTGRSSENRRQQCIRGGYAETSHFWDSDGGIG